MLTGPVRDQLGGGRAPAAFCWWLASRPSPKARPRFPKSAVLPTNETDAGTTADLLSGQAIRRTTMTTLSQALRTERPGARARRFASARPGEQGRTRSIAG